MADISQTENEIKIIIKLINITTRPPDIVLLKRYVKFNCPPTFFEAHLTDDIDEEKSTCKLFKREARIILQKINNGIWEKIVEQPTDKKEALEKRKEMVEQLQQKNVEIEKEAVKKFDTKRRSEIEREMTRESKLRDKFETANEQILISEVGVTPEETKKVKEKEERVRKKNQKNFKGKYIKDEETDEELERILEQEKKEKEEELERQAVRNQFVGPKINKEEANILLQRAENRKQVRKSGSIKISFTKFDFQTPRRESQKPIQDELLRRRQMRQNDKNSTETEEKDNGYSDNHQNSCNLDNVD